MQKALFPGYTVGPDAYEDIVNICSAYGKKAAIIGGRKALAAAEPQIRKAVEDSGIEITGTFWYGGEASRENMDMLRPQVADADMIFAVGGGKAIDTCKVLAHETNRPFFTFPTIASTCASCTSLGIVYHPDGSLREYSFSKIPPNHIFINTEIIANAPARYLWAGMGDTMAKHYECTISSRNDVPAHSDAMGIALSSMCAAPILRWGKQAMADCEAHRVTPELTEIIEAIIISTGYNGMPKGCSDDEYPWERDGDQTKYPYVVHAELNAVLNANGRDLRGSKLYVALFPCNECAKAIIQSGVKEVYYLSDKYADTLATMASKRMMDSAGVRYIQMRTEIKSITLDFTPEEDRR